MLRYQEDNELHRDFHATTNTTIRYIAEHFGEDAIGSIVVSMSGEDFSEYLRRIPGAMFRVGFHAPGHEVPLHNPKFDFNDAIIPAAATLFVLIAKARLEALAAATK